MPSYCVLTQRPQRFWVVQYIEVFFAMHCSPIFSAQECDQKRIADHLQACEYDSFSALLSELLQR
jgi:hypothetical protein